MLECEEETGIWVALGIDCILPKSEYFNIAKMNEKMIYGERSVDAGKGTERNLQGNKTDDVSMNADESNWKLRDWIKFPSWNSSSPRANESSKPPSSMTDSTGDGTSTQSEGGDDANDDLDVAMYGLSISSLYERDIQRPFSVFRQSGNNNQEIVSSLLNYIIEKVYLVSLLLIGSKKRMSDFILGDESGDGPIAFRLAILRKTLRKELEMIQQRQDDEDNLDSNNDNEDDRDKREKPKNIQELENKINELVSKSPIEQLRKELKSVILRYLSIYPFSRISLFHSFSGVQHISLNPFVFLKIQSVCENMLKMDIDNQKIRKVAFMYQWNLLWSSYSLEEFPILYHFLRNEWDWATYTGKLEKMMKENDLDGENKERGYIMEFCDGKYSIKVQNDVHGTKEISDNRLEAQLQSMDNQIPQCYISMYIYGKIILFVLTDNELTAKSSDIVNLTMGPELKKLTPLIEETHEKLSRHTIEPYESKIRFVYINKPANLVKLSQAFLYGVLDGKQVRQHGFDAKGKRGEEIRLAPNLDQMAWSVGDEILEAMNDIYIAFEDDNEEDVELNILVPETNTGGRPWWVSAIKSGGRQLYLIADGKLALKDAVKERKALQTLYYASIML